MRAGKRLRVGLYARVSTTKGSQDESPEGQLDDLRSYFARRDDCEIVTWKIDRTSGAKGENDRPGLADLMAAARRQEVDVIACKRIDRLFRSLKLWVDTSLELSQIGVSIVYSDYPQLDPTTPMGKLMGVLLAALAEFFRDLYGNAAIEGKARAAAAGKHCARPREVVPIEAIRMMHGWLLTGQVTTYEAASQKLAEVGFMQPGRVIKTTGRMRPTRRWNRAQLWRAYRDYQNTPEALEAVQKHLRNAAPRMTENTPPKTGIGRW